MQHGERFNTLTHLAGALLALGASVPLLTRAWTVYALRGLLACGVFALTLTGMYACSTVYHGSSGRLKQVAQRFDHLSIYLLIAGSYTPFCLLMLHGSKAWWLLGVVWGLALFGSVQETRPQRGARILSMLVYLAMGWAAVSMLGPLYAGLGPAGFAWLLGGGIAYTAGIVFYVLDSRLRHAHGIWHLFVVAGSAAHYGAIYSYVLA